VLAFPARKLFAWTGRVRAGVTSTDAPERIGRCLARIGGRTPWRSKCLEQALAGRIMLGRRGIASSIHLGLDRKAGATSMSQGMDAHAWLVVGDQVVMGGGERRWVEWPRSRRPDAPVPVAGPGGGQIGPCSATSSSTVQM
jgi:hypothetical protein